MISSRFSVGGSVLSRTRLEALESDFSISPIQSTVDGLVSRFVDEAASPTMLAAMTAGGMAYRLGRIGVLGLDVGSMGQSPLRIASIAFGFGSEITAFEFTNRFLQTVKATHLSLLQTQNPNLWRWRGQGGWAQGITNSAITFGMLKGAGFLSRDQSLIFQHAFQSAAMVTGHRTAGILGIAPMPEGSFSEQFLHAEATNLQLGAGMSMVHRMAPGIAAMERGLDLSIRGSEALSRQGERFSDSLLLDFAQRTPRTFSNDSRKNQIFGRTLSMSSTEDPEDSPPPSLPPASLGEARHNLENLLLDNEPLMILLTEPSQRIVYANGEARRVLGQDLIGKKITDLLHFDETKGSPHYRLKTDSGLDLLWEDRPHLFLRQMTAHYLLDVTGRAETERLLEELKIKASEGNFGREVIHDARTALSPSFMLMKRLLELIKIHFPEDIKDPPPISLDSPYQIARLVQESVEQTISIFDTGMNILRGGVSEIALDQILLDSVNLNQPLRDRNNIQLIMEMPPHLGIYGNKRGLLEVMSNLLVNACEAMPEGGQITVRAYPSERKAVIEVSDSGPGIPPHIRDRIFDPGFTTKAETGSGIGLSTVKKLVEQLHHGSIEVESEEGAGATFRIRLPLFSSSHPPESDPP